MLATNAKVKSTCVLGVLLSLNVKRRQERGLEQIDQYDGRGAELSLARRKKSFLNTMYAHPKPDVLSIAVRPLLSSFVSAERRFDACFEL